MNRWIRPFDQSGTITGVNDGSIYTFKERKYESLAREILQNSMDEQLFSDMPVRVEFKLSNLPSNHIPGYSEYKEMLQDGLDYWRNDKQENGRVFFNKALDMINSPTLPLLRISDFNTHGVLGSTKKKIRSSEDITPWFNLIKSEGSSSKGGLQGGSFGIGKNATFANSALRTVFYSTYDEEGVSAFEGIAKLATVYKDDRQYAPKAFFGNEDNGVSQAVPRILELDPNFQRNEYGTDIFILGFETEADWELRMLLSILSDFFVPIHENKLVIDLNGRLVSSSTLEAVFTDCREYTVGISPSSVHHELEKSFYYYQVLISPETQVFQKDFPEYGSAELKVLYNPDFDRKVMRTRQSGMKLFSKGNISSSIGFAGIVSLKGEELNRLFRKMENPAHTAWSPDNVDQMQEKKTAKKFLTELDHWLKATVLENAYDEALETQEVAGLGEYLPALLIHPDKTAEQRTETFSNRNQITPYTPSREDLLEKRNKQFEEAKGEDTEEGESGESGKPQSKKSKEKGGEGVSEEGNVSNQGARSILRKLPSSSFICRRIPQDQEVLVMLTFNKNLESVEVMLRLSGEVGSEKLTVKKAVNQETQDAFEVTDHSIILGAVSEGDRIPLRIDIGAYSQYSLEVELYEHKKR